MKKFIILLMFCIPAFTLFSQDNKKIEISKSILTLLQKNEYAKIELLFDQTMKTALPADKLKDFWDGLISQCGSYQKNSTISTEKVQTYDAVYIICEFTKTKLKMKVFFNDKNEIAGLFFVPENQ